MGKNILGRVKIVLTDIVRDVTIVNGTNEYCKLSLIQSGGGKRIYEATATPGTEGANLSE